MNAEADMTSREQAEKVTKNIWGILVERVFSWLAVPAIVAISTLSWIYLDGRFLKIENQLSEIVDTAKDNTEAVQTALVKGAEKDTQFDTRVSLIELAMVRGREDRVKFQNDTIEALREIRATQVETAKTLAAVAATLAEMQRQQSGRAR